jgi:hypothetical protein
MKKRQTWADAEGIVPARARLRSRVCCVALCGRRIRLRARRAALCVCLAVSGFIFASISPLAPAVMPRARAQEMVDRMVAVVNGRELITLTDLLWQLALQPAVPLEEPRQEDLRRALDLLIDQRLIAQEAEKLPSAEPTEDEVNAELARLVNFFPSQAAFYERLDRVGLGRDSAQLREIVRARVRIRKFLDFRFRSFTVVTPREVEDYYRDVFVPRLRRTAPGRIIPRLEEVSAELENELIEVKIEADTDDFLEQTRTNAEITILDKRFENRS